MAVRMDNNTPSSTNRNKINYNNRTSSGNNNSGGLGAGIGVGAVSSSGTTTRHFTNNHHYHHQQQQNTHHQHPHHLQQHNQQSSTAGGASAGIHHQHHPFGSVNGAPIKGCALGAPMATQHQTPGGYRGQWNTVGAGHQHPTPSYQPYQRYAATAAAAAAAAASSVQNQQQQQPNNSSQNNQQQIIPYNNAAATGTYNTNNSYGTQQQRVPTATSPSNVSSSSSSQSGATAAATAASATGTNLQTGGTMQNSNSSQQQQQQQQQNSSSSTNINNSVSSSNGSAQSHAGSSEQLSKTNLYIRGLNPGTTDKDLVNMCQQYGTIISTKAILDKNTNKCKGYGFVDFDSPVAAEGAVKALMARNIQAQMAKVGIWYHPRRTATVRLHQQEQDPTNLYIANLPHNFKESDLDALLSKYGQVISTRILRDSQGVSKGVGFARMETKEKCEQIIQIFNNQCLTNAKEALLVKFADGGNKKKNLYNKNNENSMKWRETADSMNAMAYAQADSLAGNGVTGQHMIPTYNYRHPLSQYTTAGYGPHWVPQYLMPAPIPPVDDGGYGLQTHVQSHRGDGGGHQTPRGIPTLMMQATGDNSIPYNVIPQLAAQMSTMQIQAPAPFISPQNYYPAYPIMHAVPVDSEHNSNAASPEDPYAYQTQK